MIEVLDTDGNPFAFRPEYVVMITELKDPRGNINTFLELTSGFCTKVDVEYKDLLEMVRSFDE